MVVFGQVRPHFKQSAIQEPVWRVRLLCGPPAKTKFRVGHELINHFAAHIRTEEGTRPTSQTQRNWVAGACGPP